MLLLPPRSTLFPYTTLFRSLTNEIVDNHAAFAAIEAAGTGVSIGASYLFHHYGHHKLERWTSMVHFGLATSGAVRNRSEEHTSELQSLTNLVCRLLLEKKNK